ncbi:MAG: hypothetical protein P4L44_16555 [Oryzomonas sp.]|uniref:hypothetical protein n=1 Tax=Oryzomonas sp. TaxID=2855186 RepID=UPI00283BEB75|nr:hypothetical protein [Oryzomonas sp.]MDR3581574.1 hypothetical protein [Oryzomonas sp.]
MKPGQTIYFKREGDIRRLKGTIIGQEGDGWKVCGCRTARCFFPPEFILQAHEIITDHIPSKDRPRKLEAGHGRGLCIPAAESIRRKEIVTARLGMSEAQVLQARAILEMRRRTLGKLAASNGIATTREDFDFEELCSEHLVATLAALRSATSKAPDAELDEFRACLDGKADDCRIMKTIARCGRTAAVRYLKARADYRRTHVGISDHERRLAA